MGRLWRYALSVLLLTSIVKFTAVVGRGEQGHQLALGKELISVLDDLMRTANQVEFVFPQEFRDDLQGKKEMGL